MSPDAKDTLPSDPAVLAKVENVVPPAKPKSQITKQKLATTLIICLCNLINFMERYALPGILPLVKEDLGLNNFQLGLLQSAFIVSYAPLAPIVGYLGDRYSRKLIMIVGLTVWSLVSFGSSYMTTYKGLLILRCFGGIGEATYSAIGPAIIGDLFIGDTRSQFLALFYFTILAGSGLGYIAGSGMAAATGSWNWGLRITPILSFFSLVLVVFFLKDPPRGESDGVTLSNTSWKKDVIYLLKNKSFMLSTTGSIGMVFAIGAVAVWGPYYVYISQAMRENSQQTLSDISLTFGLVSIFSGVLGVVGGSFMGQKLRVRIPEADALICAIGMLCSVPFMYAFMLVTLNGPLWAVYFLSFIGLWFINLNWALVGDMLLYVVIPTRRTSGESFQILTSHIFGDATSPFIIGAISDAIRPILDPSYSELLKDFISLQYAMFSLLFINVISGMLFFANSWYLVEDRAKANRTMAITGVTVMEKESSVVPDG